MVEERQTTLIGRAQERLGEFLNEEDERLDAWRNDAAVAYEQQLKALTKEANDKTKLARATTNLQAKLELQRKDVEIRELRERWGGCMLCMCLNVVFLPVVGVMGLLGSRPWACVCLPFDRCSLSYR
jgi:predicted metal-dependent hydrolase